MAEISQTAASLRLFGDDLDPDEVTQLLAAAPTQWGRKGDIRAGPTQHYVEKTGRWHFSAPDAQPGDLEGQIVRILASLTPDTAVWTGLSKRFSIDMYCGLFMRETNEGLELSPETLHAMGQRGISLILDIYDPVSD
ncbi:DUF4279 domain-containing protein [Phenylobacterium sp.]|uniref:DUF4279 domain-containing protein n=1 Tax=Phenylobacterium sp. TaxID=1871053 RepID=UPI00273203A8|nr:DUF4279 domain-containing protein [Phenylobacterium sp.]MDP1617656.1 DUF4279 domain-containing protein [Phenylobacterium sp.]MDP1985871.1 DUF4279 domain-containing protein [Phenylobacterium sp.]